MELQGDNLQTHLQGTYTIPLSATHHLHHQMFLSVIYHLSNNGANVTSDNGLERDEKGEEKDKGGYDLSPFTPCSSLFEIMLLSNSGTNIHPDPWSPSLHLGPTACRRPVM